MKKRFQNILTKTGKKNGAAILLCAVLLTASLGTLIGCQTAKENAAVRLDSSSPESINNTPAAGHSLNDYSVTIGNLTVSLYEDKQDIQDKLLDETRLSYVEYDADSYEMIDGNRAYDASTYYDINESLRVYFEHGKCVRLSFQNELPQTARGIHVSDSYSQMTAQYGDSFEKHMYPYKELYSAYRYSFDDYICEFGILEEISDSIQNLDLYIPSQYPIYDYGEEWTQTDLARRDIEDIVYESAFAYFDGNAAVIQKFLADTYSGDISVYEGTGTISGMSIKELSDDEEIENGACAVSLEFKDSSMGDAFRRFTFEFIKQEDGWKIQSYGLKG